MNHRKLSWFFMMNPWKTVLFLVPVMAVGVMAGCQGRAAEARHQSGEASEQGEAVPVRVIKPKLGGLERITKQPATVQAFKFVGLYAQVSGVLANQEVDIGSKVKKGEILAEIIAPEIVQEEVHAAAALEQAKEQVRQADKRVETAKADLEATKKLVDQREEEKKSFEAYWRYRKAELQRYKELVASEVIDRRVYDEEKDRFEAALSRKDAALAAVETARADVLTKKAKKDQVIVDVALAKANVRVAEATLAKAKAFVGFTKIHAPFDGIITKRNYNNGDFIRTADRAGQLPLLEVQVRDKMRIVVQVPDTDAPNLKEGNRAELRIACLGKNGKFVGAVSRISYFEDEKARTMRVEVDLPNPKYLLRHGMFGEITIQLQGKPENAFTLPSTCVKRQTADSPPFVYVVRQNRARKVLVHVGKDDAKWVEILDGLQSTDLVVAEPSAAISDGCPLNMVNPPPR
jgi:RND family efflux transporter MFP subunit